MNKTISINLGGRNFFVEEEACKKLEAYLNAIKNRFAEYPGSGEIVADMESRIGEKFWEKHENNPQAVITQSDVDNLILELGTVEDIAGEDGKKEKSSARSFAPKRLMRNGDDKIVAGVCSGLAAYFDMDPIIFRFIFGILVFAWGAIIPIYFLLWLIMPEAKTAMEKMQMRGDLLNLDSITETIKERAEEFKERINNFKTKEEWKQWGEDFKNKAQSVGREVGETGKKSGRGLGNFLRSMFSVLGAVIRFFVKVLVKIISLAFILAMGCAIAGITIAAAIAIFNAGSPYVGLPISAISRTPAFYILLVSAYVIVLMPLQMLLLLAVSAFTGRKVFTSAAGFALFGTWFLALVLGSGLGVRYVPQYIDQVKNSPQLQTVNKSFDAKDFKNLQLSNSISYKLVQGKEFNVKASGWAMDLDRLNVAAENGTLSVSKNSQGPCVFCIGGSPTVEITAPEFLEISAENSSSVKSDLLSATTTTLSLTNSSRADIRFDVKELNLFLGNSSYAKFSGKADSLTGKLNNSSRLSAKDLVVKNASLWTLNSSVANVNVTDTLIYSSVNSSRIYYSGSPMLEPEKNARPYNKPPLPEYPQMDEYR